jgi:hypothetical protein
MVQHGLFSGSGQNITVDESSCLRRVGDGCNKELGQFLAVPLCASVMFLWPHLVYQYFRSPQFLYNLCLDLQNEFNRRALSRNDPLWIMGQHGNTLWFFYQADVVTSVPHVSGMHANPIAEQKVPAYSLIDSHSRSPSKACRWSSPSGPLGTERDRTEF